MLRAYQESFFAFHHIIKALIISFLELREFEYEFKFYFIVVLFSKVKILIEAMMLPYCIFNNISQYYLKFIIYCDNCFAIMKCWCYEDRSARRLTPYNISRLSPPLVPYFLICSRLVASNMYYNNKQNKVGEE